MKNPDHQTMRWLDNELSPNERAEFEASFPGGGEALEEERRKAGLLSGLLQKGLKSDLSNADFFNTQILQAIGPAQALPAKKRAPNWLLSLVIPAAAALAITVVSLMNSLTAAESTEVYAATASEPEMTAVAFHVPDSEITVIWMDGLASISSNPPR